MPKSIILSWVAQFIFCVIQLVVFGDNPRKNPPYGMWLYYAAIIWMFVNYVAVLVHIGSRTPPEMLG